jgi:hypothetical protein
MRAADSPRDAGRMSTQQPRDAARDAVENPTLPPGDDERFHGYGVMGLAFSSGHYLALRCIPATTLAAPYRSVWHRDPAGVWTIHATAPPEQSCARYVGAASEVEPVRSDIDVAWLDATTLLVRIDGVLDWHLELGTTWATRLMSSMGRRLPARAWTSAPVLRAMGRAAGPMLGVGKVRLRGRVPNGQRFSVAPVLIWSVRESRAVLHGEDLGSPGPLRDQTSLGDFWMPQRGIFAVGDGHFEIFDPERHVPARASERMP